MCGIIAGIVKNNITENLLAGLKRLEYRGYDSSGLAIINSNGELIISKELGKVNMLENNINKNFFSGNIGIAHTRWATHGKPSVSNAHPHISNNIAVVHNGIIENYLILKDELQNIGFKFISDTDTEVIAHLVNHEQKQGGSLLDIVRRVKNQLKGAYAIVVLDSNNPDLIVASRSGSPLVVGLGDNENFLASDILALLPFTQKFIYLEENDTIEITQKTVRIVDKQGADVKRVNIETKLQYQDQGKDIYDHYMQKEIYYQPIAIKETLKDRLTVDNKIDLSELGNQADKILSKVEHVHIIACGTSYNAAMVAKYWFEDLMSIPCDIEIASEFRYRKFVVREKSLLITISQSGETADTLSALLLTKKLNYLASLTICNVASSSLVRESDFSIITKAGPEIGVASTKAFTTQLTSLLLLIGYLNKLKGNIEGIENNISHILKLLPSSVESILAHDKNIKLLANDFVNKSSALFLGRGVMFPIAIEGALKLKEVSYIHAEAYAAGELKHGPLALVDENMPVIILAPDNQLLEKLTSNIEEVSARGGMLYIFADEKINFIQKENIKIIPLPNVNELISPICYTIPLQLLAYYVALIKGTDVDQPRNLAKSVTVE